MFDPNQTISIMKAKKKKSINLDEIAQREFGLPYEELRRSEKETLEEIITFEQYN